MFYKSKIGLILSVIYIILTGLLLFLSNSEGMDDKGRFVFMQAPIALQLTLISELGFPKYLNDISGKNAYILYILLCTSTVIFLYVIGVFWELSDKGIKSIFPKAECPNCNNNIPRFSNKKVPSSNFTDIFSSQVICPVCQTHIIKRTYDAYIVLVALFLMWEYFNLEIIGVIFKLTALFFVLYDLFSKKIFRKVTDA